MILRLEGLAVGLVAVVAYACGERSWWLFAGLILLPDIAMAGYLFNSRTGSIVYNSAHTYLAPIVQAGLGYIGGWPVLQSVAMIWFAYIGFDRAFGYGLKYASGFRDTHLGFLKPPVQKR